MTDKLEEYRQKVAGTNIDQKSLLSTDYFNTFNTVVMVLDMVSDMPELMEEVEQWQFLDYPAHFRASGLDFSELAIEAYEHSPPDLREALEGISIVMKNLIEECGRDLRLHLDAGEMDLFNSKARSTAEKLRALMEDGNAIVHGDHKSSQTDIDTMFDGPTPAQADIDSMFDAVPVQTETKKPSQSDIDAMFDAVPAQAEAKPSQADIDAMFDTKPPEAETKKPTQADIDAMFP